MTTPSQFVLSCLSRQLYDDFVANAKARGFAFVRFQDFLPGAPALPPRYIALRHDVDFAPDYALEMARLEHDVGIVSTFHLSSSTASSTTRSNADDSSDAPDPCPWPRDGPPSRRSTAVDADIGDDVAFRLNVLAGIVGPPCARSLSTIPSTPV